MKLQYEVVVRDSLRRVGSALLARLTAGRRLGKALNPDLADVQHRIGDLFFEWGRTGLFHIEVQSTNDPEMPYRMVIYGTLGALKLRKTRLMQVLLYIGDAPLTMPGKLILGGIRASYRVIDIRVFDAASLLASSDPEDCALALLARNGVERLREIVARIASLEGAARRRAVTQLAVLSGLRKVTAKAKMEMRRQGMEFDIRSNEIIREAWDKAVAEVRAESRAEGLRQGESRMLARLLQRKFGPLPKWARERLQSATVRQIERWSGAVLTARSLESVLGGAPGRA